MAATSFDLSAIRTDVTDYAPTFRELIGLGTLSDVTFNSITASGTGTFGTVGTGVIRGVADPDYYNTVLTNFGNGTTKVSIGDNSAVVYFRNPSGAGTIQFNNNFSIENTSPLGQMYLKAKSDFVWISGAGATLLTLTQAGNLTALGNIEVSSTDYTKYLRLRGSSTQFWDLQTSFVASPGELLFKNSAGVERLRIDQAGMITGGSFTASKYFLNITDYFESPSLGTGQWSTPYAGEFIFRQYQSGQGMTLTLATAENKRAGLRHYDVANVNGRRLDLYSDPLVPITVRPSGALAATFNNDGSTTFAGAVNLSGGMNITGNVVIDSSSNLPLVVRSTSVADTELQLINTNGRIWTLVSNGNVGAFGLPNGSFAIYDGTAGAYRVAVTPSGTLQTSGNIEVAGNITASSTGTHTFGTISTIVMNNGSLTMNNGNLDLTSGGNVPVTITSGSPADTEVKIINTNGRIWILASMGNIGTFGSATGDFLLYDGTSGTYRMKMSSAGTMTVPGIIELASTDYTKYLRLRGSSTQFWDLQTSFVTNPGELIFKNSAGVEKFRLDQSGNVTASGTVQSASDFSIGSNPDPSTNKFYAYGTAGIRHKMAVNSANSQYEPQLLLERQRSNSSTLNANDSCGSLTWNTVTHLQGLATANVTGGFSTIDMVFQSYNAAGTFAERMRMSAEGNLTIGGNITATGTIYPRAGGTLPLSAPIKLTAGALMTTPENGAIEWTGQKLIVTGQNLKRYAVAWCDTVRTARLTIPANDTTEVTIMSSVANPNTVTAGRMLAYVSQGIITQRNNAASQYTIQVKIGAVVILSFTTPFSTQLTNAAWGATVNLCIRSTGVAGKVIAYGSFDVNGLVADFQAGNEVTVDTTLSNTLSMTVRASEANAATGPFIVDIGYNTILDNPS